MPCSKISEAGKQKGRGEKKKKSRKVKGRKQRTKNKTGG